MERSAAAHRGCAGGAGGRGTARIPVAWISAASRPTAHSLSDSDTPGDSGIYCTCVACGDREAQLVRLRDGFPGPDREYRIARVLAKQPFR
jgi:hypothetical protein